MTPRSGPYSIVASALRFACSDRVAACDRMQERLCRTLMVLRHKGGWIRALAYDPQQPVFCMDEQPVQLLKETRPSIATTTDHGKRVDYECERNGRVSIFMFAEPLSGFRQARLVRSAGRKYHRRKPRAGQERTDRRKAQQGTPFSHRRVADAFVRSIRVGGKRGPRDVSAGMPSKVFRFAASVLPFGRRGVASQHCPSAAVARRVHARHWSRVAASNQASATGRPPEPKRSSASAPPATIAFSTRPGATPSSPQPSQSERHRISSTPLPASILDGTELARYDGVDTVFCRANSLRTSPDTRVCGAVLRQKQLTDKDLWLICGSNSVAEC